MPAGGSWSHLFPPAARRVGNMSKRDYEYEYDDGFDADWLDDLPSHEPRSLSTGIPPLAQ